MASIQLKKTIHLFAKIERDYFLKLFPKVMSSKYTRDLVTAYRKSPTPSSEQRTGLLKILGWLLYTKSRVWKYIYNIDVGRMMQSIITIISTRIVSEVPHEQQLWNRFLATIRVFPISANYFLTIPLSIQEAFYVQTYKLNDTHYDDFVYPFEVEWSHNRSAYPTYFGDINVDIIDGKNLSSAQIEKIYNTYREDMEFKVLRWFIAATGFEGFANNISEAAALQTQASAMVTLIFHTLMLYWLNLVIEHEMTVATVRDELMYHEAYFPLYPQLLTNREKLFDFTRLTSDDTLIKRELGDYIHVYLNCMVGAFTHAYDHDRKFEFTPKITDEFSLTEWVLHNVLMFTKFRNPFYFYHMMTEVDLDFPIPPKLSVPTAIPDAKTRFRIWSRGLHVSLLAIVDNMLINHTNMSTMKFDFESKMMDKYNDARIASNYVLGKLNSAEYFHPIPDRPDEEDLLDRGLRRQIDEMFSLSSGKIYPLDPSIRVQLLTIHRIPKEFRAQSVFEKNITIQRQYRQLEYQALNLTQSREDSEALYLRNSWKGEKNSDPTSITPHDLYLLFQHIVDHNTKVSNSVPDEVIMMDNDEMSQLDKYLQLTSTLKDMKSDRALNKKYKNFLSLTQPCEYLTIGHTLIYAYNAKNADSNVQQPRFMMEENGNIAYNNVIELVKMAWIMIHASSPSKLKMLFSRLHTDIVSSYRNVSRKEYSRIDFQETIYITGKIIENLWTGAIKEIYLQDPDVTLEKYLHKRFFLSNLINIYWIEWLIWFSKKNIYHINSIPSEEVAVAEGSLPGLPISPWIPGLVEGVSREKIYKIPMGKNIHIHVRTRKSVYLAQRYGSVALGLFFRNQSLDTYINGLSNTADLLLSESITWKSKFRPFVTGDAKNFERMIKEFMKSYAILKKTRSMGDRSRALNFLKGFFVRFSRQLLSDKAHKRILWRFKTSIEKIPRVKLGSSYRDFARTQIYGNVINILNEFVRTAGKLFVKHWKASPSAYLRLFKLFFGDKSFIGHVITLRYLIERGENINPILVPHAMGQVGLFKSSLTLANFEKAAKLESHGDLNYNFFVAYSQIIAPSFSPFTDDQYEAFIGAVGLFLPRIPKRIEKKRSIAALVGQTLAGSSAIVPASDPVIYDGYDYSKMEIDLYTLLLNNIDKRLRG